MSNGVIAYHDEEIARHKKDQEEAFHKLTALAEKYGMPFSVVTEELIPLWVDGTCASNWKGWHEYGKYEAVRELEAVSA